MSNHLKIAGKPVNLQDVPESWLQIDPLFLDRSVTRRMQLLGLDNALEYIGYLQADAGEAATLQQLFSNSFSLFFRNSLTFAVLEQLSLPMMLNEMRRTNQHELRFWSAACAAGQEAYSLAILLEELKQSSHNAFNYRIFASDKQESQLQKAKAGLFQAANLVNVSHGRLQRWFQPRGDQWEVDPALRERLVFCHFDLLDPRLNFPEESVFGGFNLIMAANVLFYYDKPPQDLMLHKFRTSLQPSGCLVTGEAERLILSKAGFTEKYPWSAIFRIK